MNDWIDVKNQIPDDGIQVLATGWDNGVQGSKRHYVVAELCGDDWFSDSGDEEFRYITHWMPIKKLD